MHTILGVYLEALTSSILHNLIHTGGAITLCRFIIKGEIFGHFQKQAQEETTSVSLKRKAEREEKKSHLEGGRPAAGPSELILFLPSFSQKLMGEFLDCRVQTSRIDFQRPESRKPRHGVVRSGNGPYSC